ncbi:hypothetical protein PIB30_034834 [Stylosanthes scabra]|uniref:Glycosyltransferase n=1 Tax=Stylosanthes scabra TaxID=79078 RepID=A0ABU6XAH9_9FABA|nr:hypothetical protein [Stylosanthes scabra]
MADDQPKKLHIAVFPWLAFGHIIPFFELAKLIAQKGHKISFISTPRNIKRLPKLPLNLQPLVELIEIPLPHVQNLPQNAESTMDIPQLNVPYLKKAFDGLEEPLAKFLEKNLPQNAEATMDIPHHIVPFLKKAFDGLEEPLATFLETSTPHWLIYDFAPFWLPPITSKLAVRACREIEAESIKFLQNQCSKPIIPVGLIPPSLQLLSSEENKDDEDWNTILKWLDEQEQRSVIYVAFGSEIKLSDEEFTEIAMGLELSGFPFFWVLKKQNTSPDIGGSIESKRGILWSNWVPQLKILAHKSVGGFLSHSGWSSVIESLQFGCPLVMLPFQNEQGLIARVMEERMVGIKVARNEHDGKFSRDSLAKALRSVMSEDEGKPYRDHAEKMSKVFVDKELHQNYIDEFVDYMIIHSP